MPTSSLKLTLPYNKNGESISPTYTTSVAWNYTYEHAKIISTIF